MYIKIHQGAVQKYPYNESALVADNPQVSFPDVLPDSLLASYGVFPVSATPRPEVDYTQTVTEGLPAKGASANWVQTWVVTNATPEEISARTAAQAAEVRAQRNRLLAESDWTQMPDYNGASETWRTYRQALRDLTSQPGFPWSVNWPAPPT